MEHKMFIIDKIKWHIRGNSPLLVQPLCPKHNLCLSPVREDGFDCDYDNKLKCEECLKTYKIPRPLDKEKKYVFDKVNSMEFKNMKFINLDDEYTPIAKSDKIYSKDNKYFARAVLTESKVGLRLIVYAGEKRKSEKTEIFIEPEIRRLSFDQADLHPSDVFVVVEATFKDGTKHVIKDKK